MVRLTRGAVGLGLVFAVSFATLLYLSRPAPDAPSDPPVADATTLAAQPADAVRQPIDAVPSEERAAATPTVAAAKDSPESPASDDIDTVAPQPQSTEEIDTRDDNERQVAAATTSESVDALVQVLRSDQDVRKRSRALDSLRSIAERDSHNSFVRAALDDARHDADANLAQRAEEAYASVTQGE